MGHVAGSGRSRSLRRAGEGISDPAGMTVRSSPARFIDPMLLLRTDSLPSGNQWLYELKLDGYRAIAFKRDGTTHLRSRNNNDFSTRYPGVVKALEQLPNHTVVDGEIL